MIVLLGASAIYLTALQASMTAPRSAFQSCLKENTSKAAQQKVTAEGYDAYIRNACGTQLEAFKSAAVAFDMKNKMSRKDASEDAEAMIKDFLGSSLDHFKYVLGPVQPQPQPAAAVASAAAPATPAAPAVPASEPTQPK